MKIFNVMVIAAALIFLTAGNPVQKDNPPPYRIIKWSATYANGEVCANVQMECNKASDLLDNRNFIAVLRSGQKCKGVGGSFDMTRTHKGQVIEGVVCFGRQRSPIRELSYSTSLFFFY